MNKTSLIGIIVISISIIISSFIYSTYNRYHPIISERVLYIIDARTANSWKVIDDEKIMVKEIPRIEHLSYSERSIDLTKNSYSLVSTRTV